MKNRYLLAALSILLICTCTRIKSQNSSLLGDVKHEIKKSAISDQRVIFAEITDFEWEYLYIFPPYSTLDEIKTRTGLTELNIKTPIETSDSIVLFLFTKGNTLVEYFNLPREDGDFAFFDKTTPETAKYKVFLVNNKWITVEKIMR